MFGIGSGFGFLGWDWVVGWLRVRIRFRFRVRVRLGRKKLKKACANSSILPSMVSVIRPKNINMIESIV